MVSYQNNGNGTATITFSYTANKAKLDTTLDDAAHYIWNLGYGDHGTAEAPRTWEQTNNSERLALIDDAVRREIIEKAKSYHVAQGQKAAQAESETLYI